MSDDDKPPEIPARQLVNLWNWLPAFRVVAETENMREAAELLHITPSSLSRTVRLLEDALERPLFDRVGRNLRLNPAGHALLVRTRAAMRGIHEGLTDLAEDRFSREVRISSTGLSTQVVLPVLGEVRQKFPHLRPVLSSLLSHDAARALTTGSIDVAFHEDAVVSEELIIERITDIENRVYCGKGHPLFGRDDVELSEVFVHEFVAPRAPPSGMPLDGWPVEFPRVVGIHVERLMHGLKICEGGGFLAVLPNIVATPALSVLPGPPLPVHGLYAMCRRPLSDDDVAQRVIDLVRARFK